MYTLKLKLKSVHKQSLFFYISNLKLIFNKLSLNHNSVFLPKKTKKIILLKSPHVNKKAWEQFEKIMYTCCFFFKDNLSLKFLKFFLINKPKTIKISLIKYIKRKII